MVSLSELTLKLHFGICDTGMLNLTVICYMKMMSMMMMVVAKSDERFRSLNAPQPENPPITVYSFHRVILPFVE